MLSIIAQPHDTKKINKKINNAMWRFIKNDIYLFKPENTCQNKHTQTHLTVVFKCFSQQEQNWFTSTNNSYTPHCYKSKITNPLVRWKHKKKKKPSMKFWESGTPVYHHSTELWEGKPAPLSNITWVFRVSHKMHLHS